MNKITNDNQYSNILILFFLQHSIINIYYIFINQHRRKLIFFPFEGGGGFMCKRKLFTFLSVLKLCACRVPKLKGQYAVE